MYQKNGCLLACDTVKSVTCTSSRLDWLLAFGLYIGKRWRKSARMWPDKVRTGAYLILCSVFYYLFFIGKLFFFRRQTKQNKSRGNLIISSGGDMKCVCV